MNHDVLYNILLHSDINDINKLSLINSDAELIIKTPQFWHDKMVNDLPFISNIYTKNEYIKITKIVTKVKDIINNYKIGYTTSMNINTYFLPEQFNFTIVKEPRMLSISKTNDGYIFEANYNGKYKVLVTYNQVLNYLVGYYHSIYHRLNRSWHK